MGFESVIHACGGIASASKRHFSKLGDMKTRIPPVLVTFVIAWFVKKKIEINI